MENFRAKREEVVRDWRRLHYEKLHNFYASPNTITVIKAKRIREMENVECMEEKRNTKFWSENLKERDHSEHLGVDGKTTLECILGK